MAQIKASIQKNKYKTTIQSSDYTFFSDEPIKFGGTNAGPTPKEMLAASLAACTTITLRLYADRKEWPLDDIIVDVSLDTETKPGITIFKKNIELVGNLDEKMRERLLQVAERCPVNKMLSQPIEIEK